MRRKEAVAAQQLQLPDMPEAQFDRMDFTDSQLAKAQATLSETYALLDKYPDMLDQARKIVLLAAAERNHVGTRWAGEMLRVWLTDLYGAGFSNGCIGAIVRLLIAHEPWFGNLLETRPCALDVIMAGDGDAH